MKNAWKWFLFWKPTLCSVYWVGFYLFHCPCPPTCDQTALDSRTKRRNEVKYRQTGQWQRTHQLVLITVDVYSFTRVSVERLGHEMKGARLRHLLNDPSTDETWSSSRLPIQFASITIYLATWRMKYKQVLSLSFALTIRIKITIRVDSSLRKNKSKYAATPVLCGGQGPKLEWWFSYIYLKVHRF